MDFREEVRHPVKNRSDSERPKQELAELWQTVEVAAFMKDKKGAGLTGLTTKEKTCYKRGGTFSKKKPNRSDFEFYLDAPSKKGRTKKPEEIEERGKEDF